MGEQIRYCDRCGKLIPVADVRSGSALATSRSAYCAECADHLGVQAPSRAAPSRNSPVKGKAIRRTPIPRRTPPPDIDDELDEIPEKAGGNVLVVVGAGSGLVVGLVLALVILLPSGPESAGTVPPPTSVPIVVRTDGIATERAVTETSPRETERGTAASIPAAVRLAEIKDLIEPTLGKYDVILRQIDDLVRQFPGTPETEEAERLRIELDAKYRVRAEEALEAAIAASSDLRGLGRFDDAAAGLKSIRNRFGVGDWLETRGESRIAAALSELERGRLGHAEVQSDALAKAYAAEGVLLNGSFEVLKDDGKPYLWDVMPSGQTIRFEDGNHFVNVTNARREHSSYLTTGVVLDPAWKSVRLSARIRAKGLKGPARFSYHLLNAKGELIKAALPEGPTVESDTAWKEVAVDVPLPSDVAYGRLSVGLFNASGEADFDDVKIIPALTPEASRNVFAFGSFTIRDFAGRMSGWNYVEEHLAGEGKDRWLRLVNTDPKKDVQVSTEFPLDPSWAALKVMVRMKVQDLKVGTDVYHDARLAMVFQDSRGKKVGDYPPLPSFKKDTGGWVSKEMTFDVPEGAHRLQLQPALFRATGTLELDDILVIPAKFRGAATAARAQPLKPSGAAALKRAREAIDAGTFDLARQELQGGGEWPEDDVATADALLKEIAQREELREAQAKRTEPWTAFLSELTQAGRRGVAEAKDVYTKKKFDLEEAGCGSELEFVAKRLRDAKLVESLILDGLLHSRRLFRTKLEGRPISGRVKTIEKGVVTLKPVVGNPVEVPIVDIPPEDLVRGAELKRLGSVSELSLAYYYFVRGEMQLAMPLVEAATGEEAEALLKDIRTIESADVADIEIDVVDVTTSSPDEEAQAVEPKAEAKAKPKQGLQAEYFDGVELAEGSLKSRDLVSDLNFDWQNGSPDVSLGDRFSARWTGELRVPADGKYTFSAQRDDALRVWVDGRSVIDDWVNQAGRSLGTVELKAGWVPIKVEFADYVGGAIMRLQWEGPGLAMAYVGGTYVRCISDVDLAAEVEVELPKGPKEPIPGETGEPGQWAPGLVCEVFEGRGFTKRVGVRIEPGFAAEMGNVGSLGGDLKDNFSMRWSGYLLIPHTAQYSFHIKGDDFLSVFLDEKLLAKSEYSASARPPTRTYEAGLHPIQITFVEGGDDANGFIEWSTGEAKPGPIADDYFYHQVPELGSMGPFADEIRGLWAEYYVGDNFDRKMFGGHVDAVDFDIADLPPAAQLPKDHFSIRYSGFLICPYNGKAFFDIKATGGARLTIDQTVVVDHWKGRRASEETPFIELTPGRHAFLLEYVDRGGDANLQLLLGFDQWNMRPVSPHRLCYDASKRKRTIVDRTGLAPGVSGKLYAGTTPGASKPLYESVFGSLHFTWKDKAPADGVPVNSFSGLWNGKLIVPESGVYTFRVRHFDGVNLTINGKAVINKWSATDGWQKALVPLRAGSAAIVLSYFNRDGDSGVEVYWSGPKFALRPLGPGDLARRADALPIAKPWVEELVVADADPVDEDESDEPAKPKEPPPVGNQVRNGGFELTNADAKFPQFWTIYEATRAISGFSVRTDKSNPRTGEKSVLLRTTSEGPSPGVITSLRLPAGKYELRFWACADVGEAAKVSSHVGGMDLPVVTASEDYKQFKHQFELKKTTTAASLRIWMTTGRSRVWLDDVELEAVE